MGVSRRAFGSTVGEHDPRGTRSLAALSERGSFVNICGRLARCFIPADSGLARVALPQG